MKLNDLMNAIADYKRYVAMNRRQVVIFKKAIADFEYNVDFPMFGLLEEDILNMKKKLNAFLEKPEDFCREFILEDFVD